MRLQSPELIAGPPVLINRNSMTIHDVRELAETHSPRQLEKKFAKEFEDRPGALLRAHGMAARVSRTKAANARTGELRNKVRELMKNNPALDLHTAYRRAGVALGIL